MQREPVSSSWPAQLWSQHCWLMLFLPVVPSPNIRLIAGEGEQALQPGEISKKTANVGNNMMLYWLYKHNCIRHLRQSGGKKQKGEDKMFESIKERKRKGKRHREMSPPANPAMTTIFIIPPERNMPVRNCFNLKLSKTNTFKMT